MMASENGRNDGRQYVIRIIVSQTPAPSSNQKQRLSAVGLIIGFIFGATNIIRYGPGPNGMMRTLGQYMLGSSATFGCVADHIPPRAPEYTTACAAAAGPCAPVLRAAKKIDEEGWLTAMIHSFFMSIGTTIRTESSPILTEAFAAAQANNGRPVIMKRQWEQRMKQRREE